MLSLTSLSSNRPIAAAKAKAKKDPTKVQTLIFSKSKFKSAEDAKSWAKDNGYRADKVDETDQSYRIRQRPPRDFVQSSFRTITLTDGVKAVVGHLKKKGG